MRGGKHRGHGHGWGRMERIRSLETDERGLDEVRAGEEFDVVDIDDDHARVHALRFGMSSGARCSCVTRIPAGPIVLRSGRQEIAVGRHLARRIRVRNVSKA